MGISTTRFVLTEKKDVFEVLSTMEDTLRSLCRYNGLCTKRHNSKFF